MKEDKSTTSTKRSASDTLTKEEEKKVKALIDPDTVYKVSALRKSLTERAMTLDSSDSTTETWCISLNLGSVGFARLKVETYTP